LKKNKREEREREKREKRENRQKRLNRERVFEEWTFRESSPTRAKRVSQKRPKGREERERKRKERENGREGEQRQPFVFRNGFVAILNSTIHLTGRAGERVEGEKEREGEREILSLVSKT
jgi:hypothetical protein